MATTRATGTAQGRANRSSPAHTAITGRTSSGALSTAVNGFRHSGRSTPASMAAARVRGIRVTVRSSHGQSPARVSSTPQSRNAPTAVANPPSGTPAVASSAAPGVDQAMAIGSRVRTASTTVSAPISTDSTIRPEAASAGDAPTPRSPASTTANAPPKPTTPETIPAPTACPSPGLTPTCPGTGSSPGPGWPRRRRSGGARRRRRPRRRRGPAPAPRPAGPPASAR